MSSIHYDKEALNRLVSRYLLSTDPQERQEFYDQIWLVFYNLAMQVAKWKRYKRKAAACYEDRVHETVLDALLKSLTTYETDRGSQFTTYIHRLLTEWVAQPRAGEVPTLGIVAREDDEEAGRRGVLEPADPKPLTEEGLFGYSNPIPSARQHLYGYAERLHRTLAKLSADSAKAVGQSDIVALYGLLFGDQGPAADPIVRRKMLRDMAEGDWAIASTPSLQPVGLEVREKRRFLMKWDTETVDGTTEATDQT
jgi:hypothetical protein